ncbi:MAG: DNA-processing protein DprA [Gemmatimonadota bacterium]|jgi:DNA processing protein|nr:MAG: DNA-processing protein DprA [Gemmatimonadota bacterium]
MGELSGARTAWRADASALEERAAAIALVEVRGLGSRRLGRLLEETGSARAALRRGRDPGALPADLRRLLAGVRPAPARRVRELEDRGIRLAAYGDHQYPERLRNLCDPPVLLYLRGPLTLADDRMVGIVGTRRATPYGRRMARQIATGLAEAGWAVVSGMALGIDGAAHAAALDAGGKTVGVLGSGLDFSYPSVHRPLYRRLRRHGVLVSEFPPPTPPAPGLFPRRNRIIAALSRGVVVVQAPERSGALITADHALDLGREVLAVPGPVGLEASTGVHRLLSEGAALATSAADVLGLLELDRSEPGDRRRRTGAGTAPAAAPSDRPGDVAVPGATEALDMLAAGPASADDLVRALARPIAEVLALLGVLELEGFLQREVDGRYVLCAGERKGPASARRERRRG